MLDLSKIDLGKDEAEQDERLKEYFLKTTSYNNALTGKKTITALPAVTRYTFLSLAYLLTSFHSLGCTS